MYGIAGIFTDNSILKLTNFVEVQDYFGKPEDIGAFKIALASDADIASALDNGEMMDMPVSHTIASIDLVNEHQQLFYQGQQTYDVWLTRGVIFTFEDGRQLAFEKDIWFSEDINIHRGYNVLERFMPMSEFSENWDASEGYTAQIHRETVCLNPSM